MLNTFVNILKREFTMVIRPYKIAFLSGPVPLDVRLLTECQPKTRFQQVHQSRRADPSAFLPLGNYQQRRNKGKKTDKKVLKASKDDVDEDEMQDYNSGEEFETIIDDKQSRTMKVTTNSMRADLLLKAGLGIARNKVETLFYDSKIRVNGKKLLKKSAQLHVNDEIDVVRGPSQTNPEHLVVSRVEIVSVTPKTESLSVTLRRHKSLTIENYSDHGTYDDK